MSAGCRQEGGRGTLVCEAKRQEGLVAWAQMVGKTSRTGKAPWKIRFIQFGFVLGSPCFSEVSAITVGVQREGRLVFWGQSVLFRAMFGGWQTWMQIPVPSLASSVGLSMSLHFFKPQFPNL